MRMTLSAIAVAFVLLSLSCNQTAKEKAANSPVTLKEVAAAQDQTVVTADTTITPRNVVASANDDAPTKTVDWDKKIIKNGTINLEVKDFKKYYQLL